MTKPSYAQMEMLAEFLEGHRQLAAGMLRTADARRRAKQLWATAAVRLNAVGGARRDGPSWLKTLNKPSYSQLELLTEFLEEHPQLAGSNGPNRAPDARRKANHLWAKVAVRLNALDGAHRNGFKWCKYWTDKKAYIKRVVSQRMTVARRTGVSLDRQTPLSALDQRMLALFRPSYGRGDRTEESPLSPAGSDASAESPDKSQIQRELWTAPKILHQKSSDEDVTCGPENERPTSSASVRPSLKGERESVEWLQEIEQQRLMLEQERVALQRERNQQEARFHEQVLQRMDAMSSRVADVLLQIANSRHD